MLRLLILREKIRIFYGKYGMFIIPAFKFCLVLSILMLINLNIGYLNLLKDPMLAVSLALLCAVLPFSAVTVLVFLYLLANIFSVSVEMFLAISIFFSAVGILYYSFKPGNSYLLLVVPLLFVLKIPYLIPLVVGLGSGIVSVIPVSAGVLLYYLLLYIKNNVGVLTNELSVDISVRYLEMFNRFLVNKEIYIYMFAFAATIVLVNITRSLSVDYSWEIAIAVGVTSLLIFIFVGEFVMNVTLPVMELVVGLSVSALFAYIYKFFIFNIDYTRTEYTQFEDDEYYYYVKAVPKISVKVPEYKTEKIITVKNARKNRKEEKLEKSEKVQSDN